MSVPAAAATIVLLPPNFMFGDTVPPPQEEYGSNPTPHNDFDLSPEELAPSKGFTSKGKNYLYPPRQLSFDFPKHTVPGHLFDGSKVAACDQIPCPNLAEMFGEKLDTNMFQLQLEVQYMLSRQEHQLRV